MRWRSPPTPETTAVSSMLRATELVARECGDYPPGQARSRLAGNAIERSKDAVRYGLQYAVARHSVAPFGTSDGNERAVP